MGDTDASSHALKIFCQILFLIIFLNLLINTLNFISGKNLNSLEFSSTINIKRLKKIIEKIYLIETMKSRLMLRRVIIENKKILGMEIFSIKNWSWKISWKGFAIWYKTFIEYNLKYSLSET